MDKLAEEFTQPDEDFNAAICRIAKANKVGYKFLLQNKPLEVYENRGFKGTCEVKEKNVRLIHKLIDQEELTNQLIEQLRLVVEERKQLEKKKTELSTKIKNLKQRVPKAFKWRIESVIPTRARTVENEDNETVASGSTSTGRSLNEDGVINVDQVFMKQHLSGTRFYAPVTLFGKEKFVMAPPNVKDVELAKTYFGMFESFNKKFDFNTLFGTLVDEEKRNKFFELVDNVGDWGRALTHYEWNYMFMKNNPRGHSFHVRGNNKKWMIVDGYKSILESLEAKSVIELKGKYLKSLDILPWDPKVVRDTVNRWRKIGRAHV